MSIRIGDTAPDFEAETTEGKINFHDWIGDSWAVLFSHPKDFTPVCTTELGYMASIKPEFDRRGVKIIGLSVDPLDRHADWAKDIEETQGTAPNYPIISDADFNVSKLYEMLPADTSGDPLSRTPGRQPDGPQRVRDRTRQEDQADPRLPDDHGPQLRRGAARDRLAAADGQAQGRDAGAVEAGRRGDHRRLGLQRPGQGDLRRVGGAEALHPDRPPAKGTRARHVTISSRVCAACQRRPRRSKRSIACCLSSASPRTAPKARSANGST